MELAKSGQLFNVQNQHPNLQADFLKSDSPDEIGGLSKESTLRLRINVINNDNYATKRAVFHTHIYTISIYAYTSQTK